MTTYRPPAGIRRFVTQRDGSCRFPGCTRVAARCELDHVDPYPHGPTTPANLITVCKHHHRAKHQGGWALQMTKDGVATWTDRTGRTYAPTPSTTTDKPPDRPTAPDGTTDDRRPWCRRW